jgi:acetylornithine deacetylase/succinyl-diaminopimelate desuccinylase-like protein
MPEIDWDAVAAEAVDLLQKYIRIDTTNPAGNEEPAADWLASLLDAEGISSQKYVSAPNRANLVATLGEDESDEKPLVLLHHSDVVPCQREFWQVEPYQGIIRDGFVWGRGALDMKGMGVLEVMTFVTLKRRGVKLRRPVRLMVVADEEAGSDYGAEWLDQHHPELIENAAMVINEGGYGATSFLGVERPLFGVSMAEKSPVWLNLKATGRPGHGSMPHEDNVVDRVVRAMKRIQDWQRPPIVTEPVMESMRAAFNEGYLDLDPDRSDPVEIGAKHRQLEILLTNTISATGLHSGVKHNVIPADAATTIDCRIVPGYSRGEFLAEVRKVIDDEKVDVGIEFSAESPITPRGELTDAIEAVCHAVMPEAAVLPRVTAGFTDSRTFRRRGIPAYGFVPMLLGPGEQNGMHGNDERISLDNLRLGVEVLYGVVERVCAR